MGSVSGAIDDQDLGDVEARLRSVLGAICPRRSGDQRVGWGEGDEEIVGSALRQHVDDRAEVEAARAFQRMLFDAGLAWPSGPSELGGAALDEAGIAIFRRVAREFVLPDLNSLLVGQQIIAPAILAFGTETQRRTWLPAIWRGDIVGCQLFSEPEAGSDLASLRTRAVRDGATWRITGQKVWSSGAHLSDVGELLARTDDDASLRHRGLTMFLVDMDQPGITVRPLRQMNGSAHFCEVFLDDVVVPDDRRLGAVGQGWQVAQTSLTSERDGFGDEGSHLFHRPYERLVELVRHRGKADDLRVRAALADAFTREFLTGVLPARLEHAEPAVQQAAASLVKLFAADANWRLAQTAAAVLGPAVTADTGAWGTYAWSRVLLGVPAPRIAGGTDQIQRNIVAERGLGLPREPR